MLKRILMITASVIALVLCFSCGLFAGLLRGESDASHRRFLEEQKAIAPLLAGDPAFSDVQLHEYSAGGVWLGGRVPTAEDLARLRAGIIRAIGEGRAKEAVAGVRVK